MTGTLQITAGSGSSSSASGSSVGGSMAGMTTSSSTSGGTAASSDTVTGMKAGSAQAKAMNARMEKAMTTGVDDFLGWAKKYAAGQVKTGNQRLTPKVLADGTKEFALTAEIAKWEVAPGKVVDAWTYNGVVPAPEIHVDVGDKVRIVLKNQLPESTVIHWHGIRRAERPWTASPRSPRIRSSPATTLHVRVHRPEAPAVGMYHSHMHGHEAVVNGLFGDLLVGDVALPRAAPSPASRCRPTSRLAGDPDGPQRRRRDRPHPQRQGASRRPSRSPPRRATGC